MFKLLTRDQFRESVFVRDEHKCVICGAPAVDAHHIIDRRLFTESHEVGGYFMENGASVCEEHHFACERTTISTDEIREYAGIRKIVIPDHLYDDQIYDKWGNIILSNGKRLRGELFHDVSVQKILKEGKVLDFFTNHVKYPRTHHCPWSPGIHDDDRAQKSMSQFDGKDIVVMMKMDGEQFTMYSDYCHARSLDSDTSHPSRSWSRNFHSGIAHNIPEGWRVCAENLYAQHSIRYENLECFILAFTIWNEKNECLSWDDTTEWIELLELKTPQVLYEGIYDEKVLNDIEKNLNYQNRVLSV